MDQNVKNRLVGVIVICALAVIFLPMILDGSGLRQDELEVVIPPQPLVTANPEFEPKLIELQAKVEALPDVKPRFVDEATPQNQIQRDPDKDTKTQEIAAVDPAPADDSKAEPVTEKTEKPTPPAETKPETVAAKPKAKTGGESWVLQVGSFQDRNKALAQRDKLRKSNIAAVFIEQFVVNDKASFRVRLGPFVNRDQSRVAQNKIKAKHDIDGIIMKYER